MRAGILSNDDIPRAISGVLGRTHRDRINTLVVTAIEASGEDICLTPEVQKAMDDLRAFMFERVYHNPVAKAEESKAREIIRQLYRYYISRPEKLPADFRPQLDFEGMPRTVCDYIAGMSDHYAVDVFSSLFIPQGWQLR